GPLQPGQCVRVGHEGGPGVPRAAVQPDQHHLHGRLHPGPGAVQPGADVRAAADLLPGHDAAVGRADDGHGGGAVAAGHHGHPLLPGAGRVVDLRGHALHPGLVVHRARAGQAQRHLHRVGPGRHHVRRLHPDGHQLVAARRARAAGLALAVHRRRADHGADRAVRVLPVPGHAAHNDGAVPERRRAGAGNLARAGGAGGAAAAGLGVRAAGVWRVALVRVRDAVGDRGRDGVVLDQRAAGAVHEGAPDAAVHGGAAEQLPDGRGGGGHRVDAVLGDADGLPGRAAVPGGLLDRGDGGGDVGDDPGAAGIDADGVRGVLLGRVGVRVPGDVLRVGQRRDAVPRRRAAQRGDRQHEHGQQRGERVVEHPVLRGRHGAVLY
ncbi:hypothetical protein LOZ39_006884, partial [Ophidiomyces ophidiicola]